jgi:HK97 gp10 family phage protein
VASALEGAAELTAQLFELGAQFAATQLKGVAKEAVEIAEHKARAFMPQGEEPHKTYRGRLVSGGYAVSTLHIETRVDKRTGSAVATLGVGREAFYAVAFVELGTAHSAAQPWLRPAFESSQDAMLGRVVVSLRERIEKARKSKMRAAQRSRLSRR